MPMPVKAWANYPPNTSTPINQAALAGLEARVGNYIGAVPLMGSGVVNAQDFLVKQHGAGDMTVDVGVASTLMAANIALDLLGSIERYEYSGLQMNQAIGAADPTNPRIDRVVLVPSTNVDSQIPSTAVIAGIPTAGATLDNLNGAQAVAAGKLLLADVLVPAAGVSILTAQIQDRRGLASPDVASNAGGVILSGLEMVSLIPHTLAQTSQGGGTQISTTSGTNQYGYLAYLPKRIRAANRLRWRYQQGPTALTGNYNIGIYEPGGRLIVSTGVQAFAGAAVSYQARAEVLTALDYEAGAYLVYIGTAGLSGTGNIYFNGIQMGLGSGGPAAGMINVPGIGFANGSALGTALPTRLNVAGGDIINQGTAFALGGVPLVTLATG